MCFKLRRPPAMQQGRGSQRQPRPSLAYGDQRARGEKGLRCFAEQWGIGAVVSSPRRVYLSRMQLSEPRFEPWGGWCLGTEFPRWLRENCWGLRPEGIFRPTPALARRSTRLEWVSTSGDHQQCSRSQGAIGSPDPLWCMQSRGQGEKKASVASLGKAHWGCGLFPEGSLPFQNAALRTSL